MQPPPSRRQRRMRSNRGGPGQTLAFGRSAPVPAAGPRPASWGSPAVSRPLWVRCTLLSLNIQETKIMASNPITPWQIEGGKVETVTDFIFLGSKTTVDDDCTMKLKDTCSLEGLSVTNLDSILKSRDITLPTKVRIVKAMVFPVVMYGCESWPLKMAER